MKGLAPAALAVLLLLSGCATTSLPPVTSKDYALESDEKGILKEAGEMEERIRDGGLLFTDNAVEGYLNGVAGRLVPPGTAGKVAFRVHVVKDPRLNAFALPNGAVFVHSGILARMENEAQLATLLGHEMAHATHRHAVRNYRNIKNKSAWLATAVALGGDAGMLLGGLGTMASVTGYSRELESEADAEGLKLVVAAGYDPREAPKLFDHMKREVEEEKIKEPFFFGTHPRLAERIESFEALLKSDYAGKEGGIGREQFLGAVCNVILANARLDLMKGRFAIARRGAEKYLTIRGDDAKGHFLLGEVHRQQGGEGDEEKALSEYRKAMEIDPSYPDPHERLGVICYKKGEKAEAREHLDRYLSLRPDAPDRGYIEEYRKAVE